jgi:RNA polymerase sigma-70 factor (ECF subfamily)
MPLSDLERNLLARAVRRDPHAFSDLYVLYHGAVFHQILGLVRNHHDADDLTSETFLRAWNAIARFEDRGFTMEAWLQRIGRNLSITHLRRRGRELTNGDFEMELDDKPLSEERVEALLDDETVRRAMVELPTMQRQVLKLRFFDNLSYEQVSTVIGKPKGTARVIHHRALRSLRSLLSARDSLTRTAVVDP